MNRFDRLTGIVMLLQAKPWTARQLADRFDVSRRTILRDIDALSQLRVPVIAMSGHNGGYSLPADYSLPPVHLTGDEATVVLLALRRFTSGSETSMAVAARSAVEKLNAVLPDLVRSTAESQLRHLTVNDRIEPIDDALLSTLRHAAATGSWVTFDHVRDNQLQQRHLLPLDVQLTDDRWYVRGIDATRQAERVFRLARVSSIQPADPPPDAAAILREADAATGTYHAAHHPIVQFVLTASGVTFARDHPDFRHHLDGNRVAFRCPPGELAFYARELLRFGTEATVVGDDAFLAAVQHRIETISRHHALR